MYNTDCKFAFNILTSKINSFKGYPITKLQHKSEAMAFHTSEYHKRKALLLPLHRSEQLVPVVEAMALHTVQYGTKPVKIATNKIILHVSVDRKQLN